MGSGESELYLDRIRFVIKHREVVMRRLFLGLGVLFALAAISTVGWAATYEIDPVHSSVEFKVKHLLSWTKGGFTKFSGTIDYEPGRPENWSTQAAIDVSSVDTQNADRDDHLRGPDFFDAEQYPTMAFKSTGVRDAEDGRAIVDGVLTLHGVEKPVAIELDIYGVAQDPWGNTRAGFTGTTTIDRKAFGIEYNKVLETGGFLLGDEVKVTIEIEAIQKPV
jgi:polyisoprenoid-binding protein YceI